MNISSVFYVATQFISIDCDQYLGKIGHTKIAFSKENKEGDSIQLEAIKQNRNSEEVLSYIKLQMKLIANLII